MRGLNRYSKMVSRIAIGGLVVLCLSLLFVGQELTLAQRERVMDRQAALEMLGLLNQWRLEKNLLPLKMNDTLEAMADYQARYLLTLPHMPNGAQIHVGPNGDGVLERALYKQFNWPYYNRREQLVVGEIAAVNSAAESLAFWQDSKPHRETVTNPNYREIGIAAYPHPFGHLYIAVLGARPNVLPALVHPETGELYLGRDTSRFVVPDRWIGQPTDVKLFDEAGRPLESDWINWTPRLNVPENAGDELTVLYTDGDVEVASVVDMARDIIVLPGFYPPPDPALILANATPLPTAAPTATPEPPGPELLIVYDDESLAVVNQSRQSVNLGRLVLRGGKFELPASWWTQVGNANIYDFPAGDCLQAWSFTVSPIMPIKPGSCHIVRSGRGNLQADQLFWVSGSFEVLWKGKVIATCKQDGGQCEADLPDVP